MKQLSATCIKIEKQQLSKFKFKTEPLYCRAYLKLNVFHLVAKLYNLGGNAMSNIPYKDFTCNQICIDLSISLLSDILTHFQILGKILENNKSDWGWRKPNANKSNILSDTSASVHACILILNHYSNCIWNTLCKVLAWHELKLKSYLQVSSVLSFTKL